MAKFLANCAAEKWRLTVVRRKTLLEAKAAQMLELCPGQQVFVPKCVGGCWW